MAWTVHSLEGAGGKQEEGARWFMKFAQQLQNMKCKMTVVGLGATLLLANACYAQQEVNPDTFDANPGNQTEIGVVSPQPADDGALAVSSQQAQPASADRAELVPAKQQLVSSNAWNSVIASGVASGATLIGVSAMFLAGRKQKRNKSTSPAARGPRATMQRA